MSLDSTASFNVTDPQARYVSVSCLDLLLIELVPMAERIAQDLELGISVKPRSSPSSSSPHSSASGPASVASSSSSPTSATSPAGPEIDDSKDKDLVKIKEEEKGEGEKEKSSAEIDEEELREATYFRLEALGYRVGVGLAERFSRDRPRFSDNLDVIKFLCKDLWTILFKKQVDNLKTNHRGVYVLTDSAFRPFTRMSMAVRSEAVAKAQAHLWFPCGIIRGTLASLGINATVQAETSELPMATFQVKTVQAKP